MSYRKRFLDNENIFKNDQETYQFIILIIYIVLRRIDNWISYCISND